MLIRLWRLQRGLLADLVTCLEGVVPKEVFLLYAVGRWPNPTDLSRVLLLPLPTVSHHLRHLEARGLLRREVDPEDLRRFAFRRTPQGQEVLDQAMGCLSRALDARLDRLSPEARESFMAALVVLGNGGEE